MKNFIFATIVVVLLITGWSFMAQRGQEIPADIPPSYQVESTETDYIETYPDLTEEECIKNNGKLQVSHDAGPFCNLKTTDTGKICTDSEQCEGYCITEDINSNSGTCTEYQQLGDGCGWLEVINGEVAELCVS